MDYYAVVDLEMCRVHGNNRLFPHESEIIQIGVALLDEKYEIVDRFNSYVKPEYGRIDSFIFQLTGIGEREVSNAPVLEDVLMDFAKWLPEGEAQAVSWSDMDEKQMRWEMGVKGIQNDRLEVLLENWLDCQPMFSNIMNENRRYSLEEALIASDIFTEGRAHDGLVDASNTALLFAKMKKETDFALNSYYEMAHREDVGQPLTVSLGDLFSQFIFPPEASV
ncbi:MAG: exonuclease domain-containing protein [Bacteroidales bacterium]|nr:exonuclease domain-containing protein [Bacteroidales bacterium]